MKIRIFLLFVVAFIMLLNSCKVLRPSEMLIVDEEYQISSFKETETEYRLKPYDILEIYIASNDGYSMLSSIELDNYTSNNYKNNQGFTYLIEHDGLVKLPVLKRVDISKLTIREAEHHLEELYSKFYNNPYVRIKVINRKVYMFLNSATIAQTVSIPQEDITLIDAISEIGGISNISKSYNIKLIRGDLTKKPEVYYWNIRELKDLQDSNIILKDNDIIYIDSKPQYLTRVLSELTPYLTALTTALSIYGIFFVK